jgi:hypothetical protein
MFYRFTAACVMLMAITMLVGACSGGNTDPTTPPQTPQTIISSQGHQLWGLYDISIDPSSGDIDIVPLRTADFSANVVRFLQPPIAPIELMSMVLNAPESKLLEGLVVMDITLRHPFPGVTQFRGFDVWGITLLDGGETGQHDPTAKFPSADGSRMLNPDGFTRWWNMTEFTTYGTIFGYTDGHFAKPGFTVDSTVNPYKVFTEGLDVTQPYYQMDFDNRSTYPTIDGVFTRRFKLQFDVSGQPPFRFKYAISANWAPPDPSYKPTFPIEAYPPQANAAEAYMIKIENYEEIPYWVDEFVSGGNIIFNLTIGDWQATGGNVLDQISHVWLESPTLFGTPIDVKNTMEFVESTHSTQATYKLTINDVHPQGLDGQQMLITVESANPNTFAPQIQGDPNNFDWPDAPLAAYSLVNVPITNLTPQGDYAYVYFLPDWCATMRVQCTQNQQGQPWTSGNQPLMANIMGQDIDGYYNDYTHVQVWEGKFGGTAGQNSDALAQTCSNLGYSFQRTYNDYFDPTGSRVVIVVGLSWPSPGPPDPAFTQQEAADMQEFIANGGILFFMCEASSYFYVDGFTELFDWLGMLMEYGGGATPEFTDGYTENIVQPHWMTEGVDLYHYYSVGQWVTEDPFVLPVIQTEYDEKVVLLYPLPLE